MLILKSASPRRAQIFENLKLRFHIEPSYVNEEILDNESPLSYLKRVTIDKLELEKAGEKFVYVASDTIVVMESKVLPKPKDIDEGLEILSCLSGKVHSVYSGLAIWRNGDVLYDFDETKVKFKDWKDWEILKYLEDYKPFDKAGGYGIQDTEGPVSRYDGSYTNVMGFPLRKFYHHFLIWKDFLG